MADQQTGLGERVGNDAHGTPDTGNPLKGGGRGRTTAIASVANDDRVDQIMSTTGGALVAGQDGGVPRDIAVNSLGQQEVAVATKSILSVQRHYTGNQTDTLIIEGAGVTLKIHSVVVLMNAGNDANIAVRIGLDPTTTPANNSAKMAFSHPGMAERAVADRSIGGGVPVVEGAVGDDLRITTLIESGTDGDYDVLVTYESVS